MERQKDRPTDRIVKSYEENLRRPRDLIARMGDLAERQVADSADALVRRDSELAGEVVCRDAPIDALEREVDAFCVRLLALRQPMAGDLRFIIAALEISQDIERIGDHATNIAETAHYAINGAILPDERPKADISADLPSTQATA